MRPRFPFRFDILFDIFPQFPFPFNASVEIPRVSILGRTPVDSGAKAGASSGFGAAEHFFEGVERFVVEFTNTVCRGGGKDVAIMVHGGSPWRR